jgi:hypothetical protein
MRATQSSGSQASLAPATRPSRPGYAHDPCPRLSEERPREAERRQAPHLKLCVRRDAARIEASMRPPPGAPPRRFWVVGPRLDPVPTGDGDRSAMLLAPGSFCPEGGAPKPPGARGTSPDPQAPHPPAGFPGSSGGRCLPDSTPDRTPARQRAQKKPACSIARRHRSTSLDEQDFSIIGLNSEAGISFVRAADRTRSLDGAKRHPGRNAPKPRISLPLDPGCACSLRSGASEDAYLYFAALMNWLKASHQITIVS